MKLLLPDTAMIPAVSRDGEANNLETYGGHFFHAICGGGRDVMPANCFGFFLKKNQNCQGKKNNIR